MKKLKEMYGYPMVIVSIIIGLTLISLNPVINNNGGFEMPTGMRTITTGIGIVFLILAGYFLVNTFRKKNQ